MKSMRKKYSTVLRAKVVIEAIKGESSVAELSSRYGVQANQISKWKREALQGIPELFSNKRQKASLQAEELQAQLYQQIVEDASRPRQSPRIAVISQLKVELNWLKKICSCYLRISG